MKDTLLLKSHLGRTFIEESRTLLEVYMARVLILDFDGTLTDAEAEGLPYREGYLEDVASLADVPVEQVNEWATRMDVELQHRPGDFGWRFNGKIVAPACVDPYLRMMPIARMVFDNVGAFPNPDERDRILDRILYKYNYQKTNTVFRPGAASFFSRLREMESGNNPLYTVVVTNSHTVPVQNKIRLLGEQNNIDFSWLVERVVGSAKKYVIDDSVSTLPESIHIPNLDRPIYIRRSQYHIILSKILQEYDSSWSETTVLGDIFELDLSLPLSLGATVGLMVNPFSPEYETTYLQAHPRGSVHSNLATALEWIESLHS